MRGIRTLASAPTKHPFLITSTSSSSSSSYPFSTSAGGRGRGRGFGIIPPAQPVSSSPTSAPGQPQNGDATDEPALSGFGRGRGRGLPSRSPSPSCPPPMPSSSILPSFSSFVSPSGRGRGNVAEPHSSEAKKPIFAQRTEAVDVKKSVSPPDRPLNFSFESPGAGRGKETKTETPAVSTQPKSPVSNRHLRQQEPRPDSPQRRGEGVGRTQTRGGRGRAVGFQSTDGGGNGRGFSGERGGRGGRGGRESYARGGRGGRFSRLRPRAEDEAKDLYLGDDADGDKLTKKLGEEEADLFQETLDEISYDVLPCPMEEAYQDACNLNYRIEFEPEYIVEFNSNPDIDEKPPISLSEALEKMKPFLMEYEGIESEEEWEKLQSSFVSVRSASLGADLSDSGIFNDSDSFDNELGKTFQEIVKEVLEKSPSWKRIVDEYSGPDVITAKEQQEELEKVAKSLPENIPSSVKRFTDRALLSLQSNSGWGFDKKKKFMNRVALDISKHYTS